MRKGGQERNEKIGEMLESRIMRATENLTTLTAPVVVDFLEENNCLLRNCDVTSHVARPSAHSKLFN